MSYPSFSSGDVLTATDMNAVGMWLVKTQTIGTAVSSVTVTGAFSADYDNYLITVSGGVSSAGATPLNLKLGATVTGYYFSLLYTGYVATPAANVGANVGAWEWAGTGQTTGLSADIRLTTPFLTKPTTYRASVENSTFYAGTTNGYLNNTTSYTSFIIAPASGTMTGGTIRVYGLRN